jgi:DNA-binding NarL/FixJ family response regulator
MEKSFRIADVPGRPNGFAAEPGITLADEPWTGRTPNGAPRAPVLPPENHFRRLAARTADDSAWKAADRALAEIAVASRSDAGAPVRDRAVLERATAAVRDSLLEAAQAAADASRRARAVADMLDDALSMLTDQAGTREPAVSRSVSRASGVADQLSDREREVLTRVAEGRTNKAIAEELYVSPNTVKTHVSSLLRKLNVHTRAQLATIAVQQGLS